MKTNCMRTILFLIALLFANGASAQTQPSVSQKGSVTSGHSACWVGNNRIQDCGGTAGTGTVTSVGLQGDNGLFITGIAGSPITTSGVFDLSANKKNASANTILAGPVSGSAGAWGFRVIVPADMPTATTSSQGAVAVLPSSGLFLTGTGSQYIALSSPGTSVLGGILALSGATAHDFVTFVDTSGAQHLAQPQWTDIGGGFLPFSLGGTGIGTIGAANQCLQVNSGANGYTFGNCNGPAGNSSSLSTLFAATSTNSFDNSIYAQTWTWNALTTQTALSLTSTSVTTGKILDIEAANAGGSGYAGYFSNTGTAAGAYAVYASGKENVTGNLTAGSLNVSGNTALAGTTTLTSVQIVAGNAALTTLSSATLNVSGNAALNGTTTLTNAQMLGGNASVTALTASTVTAATYTGGNMALTGTTTTNNLTVNGNCLGCGAGIVSATDTKMSLGSPNAVAVFTADQVAVATSLNGANQLLGPYSQSLNVGTVGAGGMDTGSPPNNGYVSVYAIAKPDGTTNILACAEATSNGPVYGGVNFPAGYTYSALLGIMPINGSGQFPVVYLRGRSVTFPQGVLLSTGIPATTYTSIGIGGTVPVGAVSVSGMFGSGSAGNAGQVALASDANGAGEQMSLQQGANAGSLFDGYSAATIFSNLAIVTSQTIYYKVYPGIPFVRISASSYTF